MELEYQTNRNKHTHHCREQCLSLSLTVKIRSLIYFPGNFNNMYYLETVCFHILHATTSQRYSRWAVPSNRRLPKPPNCAATAPDFRVLHTCTFQKGTSKSPSLALGSTVGHGKKISRLRLGFKKQKQSSKQFGTGLYHAQEPQKGPKESKQGTQSV